MANSSEISDWDKWEPITGSRLNFVLDNEVMSSGNLKIKCVVSSFQLYHQSNEVSIETFGIRPTPKSVKQEIYLKDLMRIEGSSGQNIKIKWSLLVIVMWMCY